MSLRAERARTRNNSLAWIAALLLAAGFTVATFNGVGSGRFSLLLDPSAEVTRSRGAIFDEGFRQISIARPFGNGIGSFSREGEALNLARYPHNLELELFGETGWLIAFWVLAILVSQIVRAVRRRDDWAVFGLLAIYSALTVQASGDLINSRYLLLFAAAGAFSTRSSPCRQGLGPKTEQRIARRRIEVAQ